MMREWKRSGSVRSLRFLQRRAFKIWPAYYVFLLVALVAERHPLNTFFWQGLFNVQNYFRTTLGHTWSLAVEEHFYILLATLMALWASRKWTPRSLVIVCSCIIVLDQALRAVLALHHQSTYFYTHTRLDGLLLGVVLAAMRNFWPQGFVFLQRQRILLLLVIGIAIWRLCLHRELNPDIYPLVSPTLITFIAYASAALLLLLYTPAKQHGLLYRLTARLGIFSYGIYLWHMSVEHPVDWVIGRIPHPLVVVTSTFLPYLLAIPLGIISTRLIELPFLRLRERILPSPTPEPALPVT